MCGRSTLSTPPDVLAEHFGADARLNLPPRYNVAPTQGAPVVRVTDSGRELALLRWGLIPSWAKDPAIGARMINARAEGVVEKPAFRRAFARQRALARPHAGCPLPCRLRSLARPRRLAHPSSSGHARARSSKPFRSPRG